MSNDKTAVSSYPPDSNPLAYTTPDRLIQDFASRGLVVLAPESLGIPLHIHDRIYERQKRVTEPPNRAALSQVPEVLKVINAPGVVAGCNQLVGENWAIVPFTAVSIASNGRDQIWHKDDNSPANGRKQRHHHAVQIEILYYPQAVREDMGPTAIAPYSHYWTLNHEENQDNFAGSDHLDFNYMIENMGKQPVSGPDSLYDEDDIIHRRTAHDIRMKQALADLNWPLYGSSKWLRFAPAPSFCVLTTSFIERITGATIGVRGTINRASCGASGCTAPPSLPLAVGTTRRPKSIGRGLAWIR